MDTGGVAPMHAEGESNGVAVLLAGVGEGVPLPVGEESGGEEAELSSSANEGGGLELTLYSWSERRSKSKRGWKQRQQAVHRVAADSTADSAKAGEESALLQLLNGGSGDNSSNEDESDKEAEESTALEHQYEHVEQDRNGEIRRETRWRCIICNKSFSDQNMYLSHVRTHDVRADLLNLSQAAADSVALGVGSDAAHAGSIERQAFQGLALEGIQPVVLFRCLFCIDSILAFETLGELLRHHIGFHALEIVSGRRAPNSCFNPTPQHARSLRAPVHRALGASSSSSSSDEDGAMSDEGMTSARRGRVKHTKSSHAVAGAGGGGGRRDGRGRNCAGGLASGPQGRRRRNAAASAAMDGGAVACGVICGDCDMAFPYKSTRYYQHRKSHLKQKRRQSLEQENMTDEQLALCRQMQDVEDEEARARTGGRKRLTRGSLAAMLDDGTGAGGGGGAIRAEVQLRVDKLHRSRSFDAMDTFDGGRGGASSAAAAASSSRRFELCCSKGKATFTRVASFERHVATCKFGARNNSSASSDDDDAQEDDEGNDGQNSSSEVTGEGDEEEETMKAGFGNCPFCNLGLNSRTRYYVHRRECAFNPANGGSPKGSSARNNMEQDSPPELQSSSRSPPPKPRVIRQRSSEDRTSGGAATPSGRPFMYRSLTEPAGTGAAAATVANDDDDPNDDNDDHEDDELMTTNAGKFATTALTCTICSETFTHPFSCNRHQSVHPPPGYKGEKFQCPHCSAFFLFSQRYHKHVTHCKARMDGVEHVQAAPSQHRRKKHKKSHHRRPESTSTAAVSPAELLVSLGASTSMETDVGGAAAVAAAAEPVAAVGGETSGRSGKSRKRSRRTAHAPQDSDVEDDRRNAGSGGGSSTMRRARAPALLLGSSFKAGSSPSDDDDRISQLHGYGTALPVDLPALGSLPLPLLPPQRLPTMALPAPTATAATSTSAVVTSLQALSAAAAASSASVTLPSAPALAWARSTSHIVQEQRSVEVAPPKAATPPAAPVKAAISPPQSSAAATSSSIAPSSSSAAATSLKIDVAPESAIAMDTTETKPSPSSSSSPVGATTSPAAATGEDAVSKRGRKSRAAAATTAARSGGAHQKLPLQPHSCPTCSRSWPHGISEYNFKTHVSKCPGASAAAASTTSATAAASANSAAAMKQQQPPPEVAAAANAIPPAQHAVQPQPQPKGKRSSSASAASADGGHAQGKITASITLREVETKGVHVAPIRAHAPQLIDKAPTSSTATAVAAAAATILKAAQGAAHPAAGTTAAAAAQPHRRTQITSLKVARPTSGGGSAGSTLYDALKLRRDRSSPPTSPNF